MVKAASNIAIYGGFDTEVKGATFDESGEIWRVQTSNGEISCRFLVSSIGQLHHPKFPDIPGRDDFKGTAFHSAEWDHNVDLKGKNIGVIGSAASAIQFIPHIAEAAGSVTVYQRSPNWITRKGDRAYRGYEKWLARYFPLFRNSFRYYAWWAGEKVLFPAIQGAPKRSKILMDKCLRDMKKHIKDPELRKVLTPDFPIGAKRFLFSDNYYEALARDNVHLEISGISKITESAIEAKDGQKRDHDVLIYGTGFYSNPFLMGLKMKGRDGVKLTDHWANGAFAYNGITTSGFPNLFFVYGPNTNTGHSSIILKLEAQAAYIRQLITGAKGRVVEVRKEIEEAFDDEMQSRLAELAWSKVEASWYKDGDKVPNNWPGSAAEFQKRLAAPDWNKFTTSTK